MDDHGKSRSHPFAFRVIIEMLNKLLIDIFCGLKDQVMSDLLAFDQSFMAAGLQAEPLLDSEFRIMSALLPQRKSAEEIEGLIFATTMKAVRRSVGAGANAVEEDVQHLWERVSEEMQQHAVDCAAYAFKEKN